MRTDILERKEEILSWISEELTLFEIKTRLGCKYETLRSYLKRMDIEYAGQQNRKGQQKGSNKYKDSSYYTKKNGPFIHSAKLREKLIFEGKKQNKCEICGISTWYERRVPLELHHKDGDHFNNELENLQILCPNCHAVFAPNAGAAVGSYTKHNKTTKAEEKAIKKKQAIESGALTDSIGRVNERILTADEWIHRKELIINSEVDLMRFGWKTKVQEVTGLTRRQVDDTVEYFIEELKDKIYIRS
jgi:hypothetical protein